MNRGAKSLTVELTTQRGYTLLEIVLALLIAGFLLAVIVPAFMRRTVDAKVAKTKAGLDQLRTALALYYSREGKYPETEMDIVGDLTMGTPALLDEIPQDGFENSNIVHYQMSPSLCNDFPFGGVPGGWCYAGNGHGGKILPNLPNWDAEYGNQDFSSY